MVECPINLSGSNVKRWVKTVLIWTVLIGLVLVGLDYRGRRSAPIINISNDEFRQMLESGDIRGFEFRDRHVIVVNAGGERFRISSMDPQVLRSLNEARIPYRAEGRTFSEVARNSDMSFFVVVLVVIAVIVVLILFLRKTGTGTMQKLGEMRASKARHLGDSDKAQFSDVGGNREAVETMEDIVDFLREPDRWKEAAARLPRGVLLVGPPGTGKTLLARAVAGETKAAFFYTSATEFVEMFVGVGAARIRDTFEKAAAQQPAVVFIDELDAVGRRRGSGYGAMHEEREQTLNQLLVLLDGLERHDRLVVIAATNRLDVLDPALLRSGRFDRVLRLEAPSYEDRLEILKIHTHAKPLDIEVSLDRIARMADGFTGADLESLTNEAALGAVRRARKASNGKLDVTLTNEDFDRAHKSLTSSNRQFNRLDSVLVESVSQFAEPTGRAVVRMTLTTGTVLEGDVVWMNTSHIKIRSPEGTDIIVAKETVEQIVSLEGTERTPEGDFVPDRWAGRQLDIG